MFNIDEEKDRLVKELVKQYSQNIISMEEYERLLEYINKIETKKETNIIGKIIQENSTENNELTITQKNEVMIPKTREKYLSMFSWRTTNVKPINGNGGKFISLFGTNRIIVDKLPKGTTILNVNSVFGLTEIIVSRNIKIINKIAPIFSGIFSPNEINKENEELPELYIIGKAVFGNITIKTIDEFEKEKEQEKKFEEKVKEKVLKKIYDKI
ncbi:MAG: hypothetical protein LBL06_02860 [Treponema sp.]|jgi:hypothetical protein|nr:hypothetical protein [Treponema sp.]